VSTAVTRRIRRYGQCLRLVPVLVITIVVEIGLRSTTLPRLARLLGVRMSVNGEPVHGAAPPGLTVLSTHRIALYGRTIPRVLRRWPFGDTCLRRALILGFFIRRVDPVLVIGVRRDETGKIAAHAWLVVAGTTLDPSATRYLPLD